MSRLIIIGAGFSVPAGLPCGTELLQLVINEAQRLNLFVPLELELARYRRFCESTSNVEEVELERFMSFLEIEHHLGVGGHGISDYRQVLTLTLVKHLIGRVLHRQQNCVASSDLSLYDQFADRLEPGDRIFTFNYDTLLEDALSRVGKPYRFVSDRYKAVSASVQRTLMNLNKKSWC